MCYTEGFSPLRLSGKSPSRMRAVRLRVRRFLHCKQTPTNILCDFKTDGQQETEREREKCRRCTSFEGFRLTSCYVFLTPEPQLQAGRIRLQLPVQPHKHMRGEVKALHAELIYSDKEKSQFDLIWREVRNTMEVAAPSRCCGCFSGLMSLEWLRAPPPLTHISVWFLVLPFWFHCPQVVYGKQAVTECNCAVTVVTARVCVCVCVRVCVCVPCDRTRRHKINETGERERARRVSSSCLSALSTLGRLNCKLLYNYYNVFLLDKCAFLNKGVQ